MAVNGPSFFTNILSCTYGGTQIFGVKSVRLAESQTRLKLTSPTTFAPVATALIAQEVNVTLDTDDGILFSLESPTCGDTLTFVAKAADCTNVTDSLPNQQVTVNNVVWENRDHNFVAKADGSFSRTGFAMADATTGLPSFTFANA